jgi:hypothetical protein
MASPTTKPTAQAVTKIRLRKSDKGRIGSAARRSASAKPAKAAIARRASPTLSSASQAKVWPPRLVKSTSAVNPTAISAAPAKSILGRRRSVGALKAQPITASATSPSGRLM